MDMFEKASREKLRLAASKGALSVEDLWDLPLTSNTGRACLDDIALDLHKQLKDTADVVSFVTDAAATDPVAQLSFEIVKHIIAQRKAENAAAVDAKTRAETKQKILAALAKKQEGAIDAMSEEDLLKKLSEL